MGDPSGYDGIFSLMKAAKKAKSCMAESEAIASSTIKTACDIASKAIIVLSETGETARLLAKFHPNTQILAICSSDGAHVRHAFKVGLEKGLFAVGDAVTCVHTMRNVDNKKQWTMRILNVTTTK